MREPVTRPPISAASVPKLPRHVKFRHDATRDLWVILGPERVLVPDETAVAVLHLVDGARSVQVIAEELAQTYLAPVDLILADCIRLLQGLAEKAFIVTVQEVRRD